MYPVCLNISDQLCIVIGGGTVAERKVAGLLEAEAKVRLISPRLTKNLRLLAEDKRIEWQQRKYTAGDLADARLVFAATDSKYVQKMILAEAQKNGQLVNVIDAPEMCSFQVPAVVRRGDLTLAVSTGGQSPAVAARVRQELEISFGSEYEYLLNLMSALRQQIIDGEQDYLERKMVFQKILHKDIVHWIAEEKWDCLRNHLQSVLGEDVEFDISQLGRDS